VHDPGAGPDLKTPPSEALRLSELQVGVAQASARWGKPSPEILEIGIGGHPRRGDNSQVEPTQPSARSSAISSFEPSSPLPPTLEPSKGSGDSPSLQRGL
jgi:hypothetical protein